MTYVEAFKRAGATFLYGATAAPASAALLNLSFWQAAGVGGVTAVWNYVHRTSQAYLKSKKEI
jgi:hypothetical protein